jgi:putative transcriptional regulator
MATMLIWSRRVSRTRFLKIIASSGGAQIPGRKLTLLHTSPSDVGSVANPEGEDMSTFGDDLIQAMAEALAHAKGEGPADGHEPVWLPEVGTGPVASLFRLIQREPEAVRRALLS